MKVILHHPKRSAEITGPKKVSQILKELDILPETVLVILLTGEKSELITEEASLSDQDTIEIRPVISGGYG
ncbi:MAG TPA: MoaD/ThiS family protein [Nitrospiria bacterium]|nr:MoaD/ThiS family protein [Nitrospiria bacterium]